MDLTVSIVNYNSAGMTTACIESIKKYTQRISYEIIVVDNKSTDGSFEILSELGSIILVQADYNCGFPRANNIALNHARGQYFILLNNDTELLNDALSLMVEFMREHPEAGAIGPQLYFPGGSQQYSYGSFKTPWQQAKTQIFPELLRLKKLVSKNHKSSAGCHPETSEIDDAQEYREIIGRPRGCAFMVKTDVVRNEIGPLDEQFFIFTEETDWALRFHKAGYKNYFIGSAKIMHHWSETVSQKATLFDMIHASSRYKYFKKHYGIAAVILLRVTFFIGAFLNFILVALSPFSGKRLNASQEWQQCIDKLKKLFLISEPLPKDTKQWLRDQGRKFNV